AGGAHRRGGGVSKPASRRSLRTKKSRLSTDPTIIALDARLVGYAAGISRYAVLLAEALARLDGPEQYVILRGRRGRFVRIDAPGATQRRAWTPPHHRLERL